MIAVAIVISHMHTYPCLKLSGYNTIISPVFNHCLWMFSSVARCMVPLTLMYVQIERSMAYRVM